MSEVENKELIVSQGKSLALTVADGVIQNLPEIFTALKDVYRVHKKTQTFSQIVEANLTVLDVNKDNFRFLIQALTDLSKDRDADPETKSMYREMIKTLHAHFMNTANMASGLSEFLDKI